MKFEDDEVYGVEASKSGGNAMYLDYCDVAWHRPGYAACLSKIDARKEGRLDARFAACSAAIGKKTCPAMKRRMEEMTAGKALYFISREKLLAFNQYQQEIGGQAFAASVDGDNVRKSRRPAKRVQQENNLPHTPNTTPTVKLVEVEPEDGYAAAINAAMKKEAQRPAANDEVVPNAPRPAGSGLSMLEMARLKLNAKG